MAALGFEVLLGAATFTGSLVAFAKLQGAISDRAASHRYQNIVNMALLAAALAAIGLLDRACSGAAIVLRHGRRRFYIGRTARAAHRRGADVPVVVSLLNSYAGLAAAPPDRNCPTAF